MKSSQDGFSVIEGLIIILVIVLVGLGGWFVLNKHDSANQPNTTDHSDSHVTFERKASGDADDPSSAEHIVGPQLIKDQATLEKVWKELYYRSDPPAMPLIDFTVHSVVLITYQASSGGYQLSTDSISDNSDSVTVGYTVKKPGDNCATTQAIVFHYELSTIPATTKGATFQQSGKVHNC